MAVGHEAARVPAAHGGFRSLRRPAARPREVGARARRGREPCGNYSASARRDGDKVVNLGRAERATLVAIVESTDPAVTAHQRLRAVELLGGAGGADDPAA